MSEAAATREKRLSSGARVSGAFGDFYANPDPNIRRWKQQRISVVVQESRGPQKHNFCLIQVLLKSAFLTHFMLRLPQRRRVSGCCCSG